MHSDTTPEAVGLRRRVLRDLTGNDRLREALKLSDAVRRLAEEGRSARAKSRATQADSDAA
jgi:hypothetical protein